MKKICLTFVFIFVLCISVFSQSCWPDTSDQYWKISESLYGSKRLSDCDPNAYYNCHGFVMSYFEDDCKQPSWTGSQITAPYTCPNIQGIKSEFDYQNSGKYVQVVSESNANIAFYDFLLGSHSAVKEVIGGGVVKYLSKYNYNGPLVAHDLTGSWYHLSGQELVPPKPIQFWAYIGGISGNLNIVGLQMPIFSVNNNSGVTYSWSIPTGYSNISIYSGANQSSVTLNPIHSGTAILQLEVSSACGSVKTQQVYLNIQTNVCLEGTYSNSGIVKNLNTVNRVSVGSVTAAVTCPNATSFKWQRTSGNINSVYTTDAYVEFTMPSGGSISFSVSAKNGSTTLATRDVTFYNLGSFMVFPNPSTNEFKIDLNKELTFTVVLQSLDFQVKKEIKEYAGGKSIDVSGLKSGDYSLSIYFEGKPVSKQRIFISKQ